jgi:hypothetical protein
MKRWNQQGAQCGCTYESGDDHPRQAQADGVTLSSFASGIIEATGDEAAVNHWAPLIREHKSEIIATLEQATRDPTVGSEDTATTSYWWRIHYADREAARVAYWPSASHAEVLARHPDAIGVEPFTWPRREPIASLVADEELTIRSWLALIDESDRAFIDHVLNQCRRDVDARDYYLRQATEAACARMGRDAV